MILFSVCVSVPAVVLAVSPNLLSSECVLLQANRMADALLIADLAGRDELMRVQQMYMKKQPSPYMRVVKAIQGNDFVSESQYPQAASSMGLTKPYLIRQ